MLLPNRHASSASYRYGFNGMEKDDELKGDGNSYDFGARMLDPRIMRWFATDPFEAMYPYDSPYSFAGNSPLSIIDPDGNQKIKVTIVRNEQGKIVKVNTNVINNTTLETARRYVSPTLGDTVVKNDEYYDSVDIVEVVQNANGDILSEKTLFENLKGKKRGDGFFKVEKNAIRVGDKLNSVLYGIPTINIDELMGNVKNNNPEGITTTISDPDDVRNKRGITNNTTASKTTNIGVDEFDGITANLAGSADKLSSVIDQITSAGKSADLTITAAQAIGTPEKQGKETTEAYEVISRHIKIDSFKALNYYQYSFKTVQDTIPKGKTDGNNSTVAPESGGEILSPRDF